MKYNLKSSEKLSLMNIQSNHTKAWYLYFSLIIMLDDTYILFNFDLDAMNYNYCYSANFDFLIYIFAQPGSRCLIVAFKLGASIKYPTLYLHQHPIPIFLFLFNLISKIHSIILNMFKQSPLRLFSTSIKYLTLITPYPSHTWYENSCFPPKAINENISNIDCFRIFVIIFIVCLFVRKLAKLVRCPFSSYPSPTNNALSALVSD